jgi:hemerythrin-like domain-containing protein
MKQDAIDLLKEDHQTVKNMLKEMAETDNSEQRSELLAQVVQELKIHTQIEEEIFYPAYQAAVFEKADERLYFEAIEEHQLVDMLLPKIQETDTDSEVFAAQAKVLQDIVEHHISEEETQMLPKARETMEASQLEQLGLQLEERRNELRAENEPEGEPENEPEDEPLARAS